MTDPSTPSPAAADLDEHLDEDLDEDLAHERPDLAHGRAETARRTTPRPIIQQRLNELPALIVSRRRARGLALRNAAAEIGIAHTSLARAEAGGTPDAVNLLLLLEWLDLPPAWFVEGGENRIDAFRDGWNACASAVMATLARTPPGDAPDTAAEPMLLPFVVCVGHDGTEP